MKDKVRFDRTIQALVTAFFQGTLVKGDCRACAVGNIVAHCNQIKLNVHKILKDPVNYNKQIGEWRKVFVTDEDGFQKTRPENYEGLSRIIIDSTGYQWMELAKIENAFEKSTKFYERSYTKLNTVEIMQDQYNGLMAVVEVLCEIEGIENPSEYKEMFAFQKA